VNGPGRLFDRAVVVIPAHNEAGHLPSSVKAVLTAAARLPLPVTVVLDGCDDGSAALAGQFGFDVHFVAINACNVGAARAMGFSYARTQSEQGALDDSRIWQGCCWPGARGRRGGDAAGL
jgi:glycosyltransferase involved in cell wall biosynthesis